MIVEISQFDILPMNFLETNVMSFNDDESQLNDKNFNDLGYESTVAIENMGSMFYYLLGIGITATTIILIKLFKKRFPM
jgi:hypothetical protein